MSKPRFNQRHPRLAVATVPGRQPAGTRPYWSEALRSLREAGGLSQRAWADFLGYGLSTVQRWERGQALPDAAAEASLLALCQERGLCRRYDSGHLQGVSVTLDWLADLLAAARLGGALDGPDTGATHTDASEPGAVAVQAATRPALVPLPARGMESAPSNLPVWLTSFIGRERDLEAVAGLLVESRLLTLTGPGGSGKTRLALQAAAIAARETAAFPDGVCFVDLAPLQDPAHVPSAVARALGVQGFPGVPIEESVQRFLRAKRLLVLLDNYEHLLAAAAFAGALLQAAPAVTVLVTSRAPLRLRGEREYAVNPLPLPALPRATAAEIAANPAVALFVTRAQDVRAGFVLTDENAAATVAICTRLDGLPLAIELAAARVRALPPDALLARLAQRLPLLTRGARDVPARQQTLRDTIAWSYALLEPAEQRLFRRLGVFVGGCTLESAAAVCDAAGDLGLDVLDGVSSLLEQSLLREVDGLGGEPRYRMLETIREFAVGELEASGEAETVRRQLAGQILQFVRQATVARAWARLDAELDNARAVLGWCVDHAELGVGVRLLWALQDSFSNHGGLKEQEGWRQRLLALPEAVQPSISRARLLAQQPASFTDMEHDQITTELKEAIGLSRELGDQRCLAAALRTLANLRLIQGRYDDADPPAEEAVTLFLAAGVTEWAVNVRGYRINAALARGELATAEALLAANQTLARTTVSAVLRLQEAWLAEARGDIAEERRLLEEFVQRVEVEQGEQSPNRLLGLWLLAWAALRQHDIQAAVTACAQNLEVQRRLGQLRFLPGVLSVLALAAERGGLLSLSTRLSAAIAASRLPPNLSSMAMAHLQAEQQAAVARVRAALGEAAFAEAWAAGEALSADAAIELGLAVAAELQQLLAAGAADRPGERSAAVRTSPPSPLLPERGA